MLTISVKVMLKEKSQISLDRELMRIPKLGLNSNEKCVEKCVQKCVGALIVTDRLNSMIIAINVQQINRFFDGLPAQRLLNGILMQFVFSHQSIDKLFPNMFRGMPRALQLTTILNIR